MTKHRGPGDLPLCSMRSEFMYQYLGDWDLFRGIHNPYKLALAITLALKRDV